MYKPLPDNVTISNSAIQGLGLIAVKQIACCENLGFMHYKTDLGEIIRSPLGGFLNHSEAPNCTKVQIGRKFYLITKRDISVGEELTITYDLYKPNCCGCQMRPSPSVPNPEHKC